jgi:mono/diheme cytochrome c family protein
VLLTLLLTAGVHAQAPAPQVDAKRGEYLAQAGGCVGCHTEDRSGAFPYAGGRVLTTPFGVFYGPNITPHPERGIGRWTETDFVRAMRQGVRPDGANYFPVFPYPSFTNITDADLRDLWAYLRTLPASSQPSREHDLPWWFRWRFPVTVWKWLFFEPGPFQGVAGASPAVSHGTYLVKALGHCGECHTPRNFVGGPVRSRELAGGPGPDGKRVPGLRAADLELWSDADLKEFFRTGVTPDGESVSSAMDEVIRNTTSRWRPQDVGAVIAYLRSLRPVIGASR